MAGKSRCRSTLLCIGLIAVCMAGCGAAGGNDGTGEDIMTDESIASAGEDEKKDEAAEGQTQEADLSAGVELDVWPIWEDVTSEGLSLSIFGDSISTYEGYIPEGFNVFYPLSGEVTDVSQTWWMQLLDDTGMELCSNNSSSGSTCAGDSLSVDDPQYGCSGYRVSSLTGDLGKMPDVVIVYIGTNDLLNDVPLGDNDGTELVEEGMIENFSDAYCLMLDKIASDYPATRIYCCTLVPVGDWGKEQPFVTFINGFGLTSEDYSDRIRTIAQNKGIPVIDLDHCGIEIDNLHIMTSDGVHLTPDGMKLVERAMLDGMKGITYAAHP